MVKKIKTDDPRVISSSLADTIIDGFNSAVDELSSVVEKIRRLELIGGSQGGDIEDLKVDLATLTERVVDLESQAKGAKISAGIQKAKRKKAENILQEARRIIN